MKRWLRNILDGMATITIYPRPMPPRKFQLLSDEEAMAADWMAVGNDLRKAMDLNPPASEGDE
jgi:hypothetical protein